MSTALLVCPASGLGAAGRIAGTVADRLRRIGGDVELFVAVDAEAMARHARAAVTGRAEVLAVLGGDGAVHAAVQACAGTPTALAIIPAGTGNDFARALGASRDSAVQALREGRRRRVDLGRVVDGGWFGTVLCAGFDAKVSHRVTRLRWPRGARRYDVAIVVELATLSPRRLRLGTGEGVRELEATLIAVGNTRYYGGGVPICPGADPSDGLFDVTVVGRAGRLELLMMLGRLRSGRHLEHPAVTTLRTRSIRIEGNDWVGYADGERQRELPLTAECVSGALTVVA